MNAPRTRRFSLLAPLLAALLVGTLSAQGMHADSTLYTRVDGGIVRAALEIEIDSGWHLYHEHLGDPNAVAKPTTVELTGAGIEWGPVAFPEPHKADQPGLDSWVYQHDGTIVLYAQGTLGPGADGADAAAEIDGLTCEDLGTCVPYYQKVKRAGPGADALFAAFPEALAQQAAPGPAIVAAKRGGKADSRFFARIDGSRVRVAIPIEIQRGWHLYHDDLGNPEAIGKPTVVELLGAGVTWSEVRFPEPEKLDQVGLDTWIFGHGGEIVLHAAGVFDGAAHEQLGAELDGLTCEDLGSCVPYSEIVASAGRGEDAFFSGFPDELFDGLAADVSAGPEPTARGAPTRADAGSYAAWTVPRFAPRTEPVTRGLASWLLLAFVAGMILNVMPCVLPVISIKILSFVQQAGEDKRRILALGLAFAAGILVVFLGLAGLAVFAGLSWGEQFQTQEFLIVMIGIVFAFALSLFGVFELGVPAGVGAAAGPPREGLGDAFFKGMLATILATPCSGPFLGSTLTWTLGQPPLVVFAIFTCLGLGMALPYVLLTGAPGLLKLLPKPGAWMDTFKQLMGFVLLATVIYLMISLRQDLLLYTTAFLVFVGLGCWWWGRFATFDQSAGARWATLAFSFAIAGGGAWVAFEPFRGLFVNTEHAVAWEDFEPERFEDLLESGRSVFVDFTADWCPNCKLNEKVVYESDEVAARLREKDVVSMLADITEKNPRTDMLERLMSELGAKSIPFMAVFPGDAPFEPQVRWDIVRKKDMLSILDALPDPRVADVR